jgi:hypothetical protein
VLEDFHYLSRTSQRNITRDLKIIYERSDIRFVLVGVWADRTWLRSLPGGVATPVLSVEVPRWSDEELYSVLVAGGHALGREIAPNLADRLVTLSQENIGLLQDLARLACREDTASTPDASSVLASEQSVDEAAERIKRYTEGRLRSFIGTFSAGRLRVGPHSGFNVFKGMLHAILVASETEIRDGLTRSDLFDRIKELYKYEAASFTPLDLLHGLDQLQAAHRILRATPVLGYDPVHERLHVVDAAVRLSLANGANDSLIQSLPREGEDT